MADVLALVDDLFFQAKLAETARHVGVTLQTVANGDALAAAVHAGAPRLVLIDLNARMGAIEAVERLCGGQPGGNGTDAASNDRTPHDGAAQGAAAHGGAAPVIAFVSHVQTALAARARAAGCTQVLPRSGFTAQLGQILRQAKP